MSAFSSGTFEKSFPNPQVGRRIERTGCRHVGQRERLGIANTERGGKSRLRLRCYVLGAEEIQLGLGQRHLCESNVERGTYRTLGKSSYLAQCRVSGSHRSLRGVHGGIATQRSIVSLIHFEQDLFPHRLTIAALCGPLEFRALREVRCPPEVGHQLIHCEPGGEA